MFRLHLPPNLHASCVFCHSLLPAGAAFSEDTDAYVVEVREEWELVSGSAEPDTQRAAGDHDHVTLRDLNQDYFAFVLNLKTAPDYAPGGMQVIQYRGDQITDYRNGPQQGMLRTSGETVRWRQRFGPTRDWSPLKWIRVLPRPGVPSAAKDT